MSGNHALHPSHDELTDYGLGKLHPPESIAIETHIAECEECCETLHGLGNDTFVDLVRESNALQLDSADVGTINLDKTGSETVSDLPSELTNHPRYRVLELLGKGGMGNVYKAQHSLMNRMVAVKVINRDVVRSAHAVERFRREVQSAAQLAHPNIVTAHDAEQAGDMHLLVMEYVPGDNLADVVKRDGPLKVEQACNYIRQAALGLQHAHDSGMVHRDIKPHNLMVTRDEQIKILDFGLATLTDRSLTSDAGELTESHTASNLTSAGSVMGTPDFISPEQATDASAADIRSDIYSLGCTFFYLLTSRPPFSKGTALDRIKAHCEQEVESIESIRDDVPPELAEILRRMVAKDPSQRFQTPAEIADALAPFVDAHRTSPAQDSIRESANVGHRSWWPPTIVQSVALAGFALILAGIFYITTNNGTLEIEAADDSVELVIRSVNSSKRGQQSLSEMRIVDTVTGSAVKRLPSGEYVVELKGDRNDIELDKDRFVLKRGDKIIVRVRPVERLADIHLPAGQLKREVPAQHEEPKPESVAPTVRQVWANPIDTQGSPSPDGRWLTFNNWPTRELGIRSVETGEHRQIGSGWSQEGGFPYWHVWSPDGERIALSWADRNSNYNHLRIIGRDGTQPRELYHDDKLPYILPVAWSVNDEIVAIQETSDRTLRFVVVSITDGSLRPLISLGWDWPLHFSLSPDGRYLIYDQFQTSGAPHRDVFIIATDGSSAAKLVAHAAHDYAPVWMPDGKRIVFTSNRGGSVNLWALKVEGGKALGSPQQIPVDMTRMLPMGVTQDSTYYYRDTHFSASSDIYIVDFDPDSGELLGVPSKASQNHEGFNSRPIWSPDGKQLAFESRRGPLTNVYNTPVPIVRDVETGRERALSMYEQLRLQGWSHDGTELLFRGRNAKSQKGFYSLGVNEQNLSVVCRVGKREFDGSWSPDGQSVLFLDMSRTEPDPTPSFDYGVFSWNRTTGEKTMLYRIPLEHDKSRGPHRLAVCPDGQRIAIANRKAIQVMSISERKPRAVLRMTKEQEISYAAGLAWTKDGKSLIYGTGQHQHDETDFRSPYENTQLWLVDVEDGEPRKLGPPIDGVSDISLHPYDNKIAYAVSSNDENSTVKGIWALDNFLPPLEMENSAALVEAKSTPVPSDN